MPLLPISTNLTNSPFKQFATVSRSRFTTAETEVRETVTIFVWKALDILERGEIFESFSGNLKQPLLTKSKWGMNAYWGLSDEVLLRRLNFPARGRSTTLPEAAYAATNLVTACQILPIYLSWSLSIYWLLSFALVSMLCGRVRSMFSSRPLIMAPTVLRFRW